jgi:hypothetical protein
MAWRAGELQESEWLQQLPAEVIAELGAAVAELRKGTVPLVALRPDDFDLSASRALMHRVKENLQHGRGFFTLTGLPVREWGVEGSTLAYWLLSSLIARPVAQKLDGMLVYDVQDTGLQAAPGSGVRPAKTNSEQNFHNDNSYARCPPEYVGLLCLQTAVEGGRSGVASIHSIHNELLKRYPQSLERLYQPFLLDRQKEHAPGDEPLLSAPIFADRGRLKMRMTLHSLFNAYKLRGTPLDAEGEQAIAHLKEVLTDPGLCHNFSMSVGDMQFVNNQETCHRRTAFVDDPVHKRHLVRLWLRDSGGRGYDG